MDRPTGARKRLGRPAAPHLNYSNPIAFFSKPQRRNAAAEPGSDHDKIEIEPISAASHNCYALHPLWTNAASYDQILAALNDLLRNRLPKGHNIERLILAQSPENGELRPQHVSLGARSNDHLRCAFDSVRVRSATPALLPLCCRGER